MGDSRPKRDWFLSFSSSCSSIFGSRWSFLLAIIVVFLWGLTGPYFRYSDTWQLVINTGTTIVTFLMVFLIQNTQNRDAKAINLKLNEIVFAIGRAKNDLIDAEKLSDDDWQSWRQNTHAFAKYARSGAEGTRQLHQKLPHNKRISSPRILFRVEDHLVCGLRARLWGHGIGLTAGKIHLWRLPRALTGSKVSLIPFEARHICPNTVGELANKSVVVLESLVVPLSLYRDSVFCSRKLVLKPHEVLVRTKLGIVLDNGQKSSNRTIQLLVGCDLFGRVAGGKKS
jgi:low affinity Fe/Cu permease